jgi:hypothetical protein
VTGADAAEEALQRADEAFGRLDIEAVVAHLSAAIRGFTAAGEPRRAAMASVRLGDTFASGLGNLVASRAWYTRAWRLVEAEPPCIEQGWVAVAAMGCDVDDPEVLLAAAELALDRARQFGDLNLETKALADGGLAHVQAGRIAEGMAMLDEAMALACGPADDVGVAGRSVCSFFTACYHAADFERADTWTPSLRQHGLIGSQPGAPVFLSSHCDSVQASVLVELGRWADAEAVLLRAKAEFEAVMPVPTWHPDLGLADLRIRQDRLAEAEALLLGKDHYPEALLPAAALHLASGDHDLARAAARRGLQAMRDDRLRAACLLAVLVDAELAAGDLDAADRAAADLAGRVTGVDVPRLRARSALATAKVRAAGGDPGGAVAVLAGAVDALDPARLPWLRACLLVELARLRQAAGDETGAAADARAATAALGTLDASLPPADHALLQRLAGPSPGPAERAAGRDPATLTRDGKWWIVAHDGTNARLRDTKGLRYLAELLGSPGAERHALDLVDRVEGVDPDGPSRHALGDAGPLLDARARAAYRHRIEALREAADEAVEEGRLEEAEAHQDEIDQLVRQLAAAFGLGGRDRPAAAAAERARLNVTRALRTATAAVAEALPGAGDALDRGVRTGHYCCYQPVDGDIAWIVQS